MSRTVTTLYVACLPLDDSGPPVSDEYSVLEALPPLDSLPTAPTLPVFPIPVCDCELCSESLRG